MRRLSSFIGYAVLGSAMFALAGCASVQGTSRTPKRHLEIGLASYYAHRFHGLVTASGEIYDENRLTAAHPRLPFGTWVRVTNLSNNRIVVL